MLHLRWLIRLSYICKQSSCIKWRECVPVTSSFNTSSRFLSTLRPSRISSFVLLRSFLAVAMTGKSVVLSNRLASWRPMPRDAGDTKSHGFDIMAAEWIQGLSFSSGRNTTLLPSQQTGRGHEAFDTSKALHVDQ